MGKELNLINDDITELTSIAESLKELFIYDPVLEYTQDSQEIANKLLTRFALLSGTFNENIANETKNIDEQLTIIDKSTNQKLSLIDTSSMENRVQTVLDKNNLYSCLKSLALSNKCAHRMSGPTRSLQAKLNKLYADIYGCEPLTCPKYVRFYTDTSIFAREIMKKSQRVELNNDTGLLSEDEKNKLKEAALHALETLTKKDFDLVYNSILKQDEIVASYKQVAETKSRLNTPEAKENYVNGAMMARNTLLLKTLGITVSDGSDISPYIDFLQNHKYEIINEYLIRLHKKGNTLLHTQNLMFAVKAEYAAMIGQLLSKDKNFKNLTYELIETPDIGNEFFHNLLVIDDPELQYYVEVHIPTYISDTLVNRYGFIKTSDRTKTLNLGAAAVYNRINEEMETISRHQEQIEDETGKIRAKIITRKYGEDNATSSNEESYKLITNEIKEETYDVENLLLSVSDNAYQDAIATNRLIRFNEIDRAKYTQSMICQNYQHLFYRLKADRKLMFISHAAKQLSECDDKGARDILDRIEQLQESLKQLANYMKEDSRNDVNRDKRINALRSQISRRIKKIGELIIFRDLFMKTKCDTGNQGKECKNNGNKR